MTGLLIGPAEREQIAAVRARAAAHPVDMTTLAARSATPEGKAAQMAQMSEQSIDLPGGFRVTYSIEDGHPGGRTRHLSVSVEREGRTPHPTAVWMIAEEFGFVGGLEKCDAVWPERLLGRVGIAVNVVQSSATAAEIQGSIH